MQFHGVPLIEFLGIPEVEDRLLKHGRGGARPGPKPNPDARMVTTAFVITQRHAAWLEAQSINTGDSKSELVRRALDIFIQMSR